MVVAPPPTGVNTMVICPDGVTLPWMVDVEVVSTGPIASWALLVPVKTPLVEVPRVQSVWSPTGMGLAKLVLDEA